MMHAFSESLGNSSCSYDVYDDENFNASDEIGSLCFDHSDHSDFILKFVSVKVCLIICYSIVFLFCFIGNVLVMIVLVKHRRMRTATNFFLANLSFADLCVGIFCVYQNLWRYLMDDWALGDFMCKMYHFINGLSYTTSVNLLMIICVERYLAIARPLISKQMLTFRRLKIAVVVVWLGSALYCSPRLIMYGTADVPGSKGQTIVICILKRSLYNSKIYDLIQFIVLFVVPLIVMSVLYMIISLILWNSSVPQDGQDTPALPQKKKACIMRKRSIRIELPSVQETEFQSTEACSSPKIPREKLAVPNQHRESSIDVSVNSTMDRNSAPASPTRVRAHGNYAPTARRVLKARRKVIKLLCIVVLSFALCNLPFHARKLWTHWSPIANPSSDIELLLTPITFIIMYFNSGINPILYAFFSDNFRKCMIDVLVSFGNFLKVKLFRCS